RGNAPETGRGAKPGESRECSSKPPRNPRTLGRGGGQVNEDLWKKFEKIVSLRGRELDEALEGLLEEELMVDLEVAIRELVDELNMELDFKPG
ncbi:MAG: hypothetical protein QXV41_03075, partial [Zestosphaera sp.]